MADSSKPTNKEADRRTFLKIGAGVVAGAAVASVAGVSYYDSVIGGNNSSSSSSVSSLQNQLSSTAQQLSSTQQALNTAQGQVSSLTGQLSSAQQALTSANGQISTLTTQVSTANAQAAALQANLDSDAVFLVLNVNEQAELLALTSAIIPTDSTGPGAKEAGCAYFIDHQLKGLYGNDGNCYVGGPYVQANTTTPVIITDTTWNGTTAGTATTTYTGATATFMSAGTTYTVNYPPTANVRVGAGTRYQYPWNKREFWRLALAGIETYCNATPAYGTNFENLSAANQTQVLTDLWSNKPTAAQFNGILPSDFAYELFFMTWAGFGMDPVYGGNRNMVGWTYTGFNGVNQGNFYGEGMTTKQIMLMTTPVTLKPVSLGQYQKGSP
jgi:gluconate 2-dehydrogenase gamma chain